MKIYIPRMLAFIAGKVCAMCKALGRERKAECVHHSRGRFSVFRLLNQAWWFPSCLECNGKCESDAEFIRWAKENGFLGNRQASKPTSGLTPSTDSP